MISPVWLQVVVKGKHQYEITGTHDIKENRKWMKEVRSAGAQRNKSKSLVFITEHSFDLFDFQFYHELFSRNLLKRILRMF